MMGRDNMTSKGIGWLTVGCLLAAVGCSDPPLSDPEALDAPVSMDVADGEVCLPELLGVDATLSSEPLPRCGDDGNGFALVVNQRSSNISVLSLGQERARWANLDSRRPGISRISVGTRPIDVATTGEGTAAVVANESDATLTGIDLWTLRPLQQELDIEGTPRAIEAFRDGDDNWRVATLVAGPNHIDLRGGLECERPADGTDRRDHMPDDNCTWGEGDPQSVELPGRAVDMAVDEAEGEAWVVYRDRNEVSLVELDEGNGNGDEGESTCLDEEDTPPCEVARIGWDEVDNGDDEPSKWGATKVELDPLGLFAYVLDRPNNRLLVLDRQRRTLIDASQSVEPPASPFRTGEGIPLVRSAMAMSADVQRDVIDDSGTSHVAYRLGVRVAANNGQIYDVGAMDFDCVFDGDAALSTDEFVFDAELRADSEESRCLVTPEFPLGANPDFDDDDELGERRFIDIDESTRMAVTPIFGLHDGNPGNGQISPHSDCELPDELHDEGADSELSVACDSPAVAQPLGLDVDDDLDSYADETRADLMEFAQAYFDGGDEIIERYPYDLRLVNEEWSVTYEGDLPEPGQSASGLVSRDDDAIFRSGGTDYCSAAVEQGDRLTIFSPPGDASGCDVFDDDDPYFRSWRVESVDPFQVELAVIDDEDYVQQLPTRSCFDRGLNYSIRATDEWTVVGSSTGMMSPRERDGDVCVMREGADMGWFQGRVETGEEFLGPYLRFQIRPGELEPVQGLSYSFGVERNFSLSAVSSAPDDNASLPSQLLSTPDLGNGRNLVLVDGGGDRLYIENLSDPDRQPVFLR